MSKIYEQHTCEEMPDNYAVVRSAANGWLIASKDGNVLETKVIGIRSCPFCSTFLSKEGRT